MQNVSYKINRLICVACLLGAGSVFNHSLAQSEEEPEKEESHTSYLAVRVGGNFAPVGFNAKATSSPQATSNISVALDGVWMPHRNVGFILSFQNHNLTSREGRTDLDDNWLHFQNGGNWNSSMVLSGLHFSKPYLDWDLEARILTGPMTTNAFTSTYSNFVEEIRKDYQYDGNSWFHQVGVSARWDMKPGFSVGFNLDQGFGKVPYVLTEKFKDPIETEVNSEGSFHMRLTVVSFALIYSFPHYIK